MQGKTAEESKAAGGREESKSFKSMDQIKAEARVLAEKKKQENLKKLQEDQRANNEAKQAAANTAPMNPRSSIKIAGRKEEAVKPGSKALSPADLGVPPMTQD